MANETENRRQRLTSNYVLVVHAVTTTSVNLWVGALEPSIAKPHNWRLVLRQANQGFSQESADEADDPALDVAKIEHLKEDGDVWKRPFDKLNKRFYCTETFTDLTPGQDYTVAFEARNQGQWVQLEIAFFSTLPVGLPDATSKPFTVGVGSCFYTKHDGGRAGSAYEALFKDEDLRPDITFLAGDQVYVDIGLGLYPLNEEDCQDRIADHYAESWALLRSVLRRGGTWMLPDDHEYWNNYPYLQGFNPYLVTLDLSDNFKNHWERAAKTGVEVIQQVQTMRTFMLGQDLAFCLADLRSERFDDGFVSEAAFVQLIDWVKGLTTPGVLVIPQPLIADKGNEKDANLPDWQQYNQLLIAIQNGAHDIVVLTGDVHYGRVAQVHIGNSTNKLVEVITSPMSNLSELNGVAASTPKQPRKKFPFVNVPEVSKNKVTYLGKVSTEQKWWDLRFPVRRTTEHFMTVAFHRDAEGVVMQIRAWEARNIVKKTGLPKPVRGFNIPPIRLN